MNKNKLRMRADKLLKNLRQYESYAEYYEALRENGSVPMRKAQAVEARAIHYRETVKAVEKTMETFNKMERDVITLLYFTPDMCVDDVCDKVAADRSTVYRYRASALDKIAESVF